MFNLVAISSEILNKCPVCGLDTIYIYGASGPTQSPNYGYAHECGKRPNEIRLEQEGFEDAKAAIQAWNEWANERKKAAVIENDPKTKAPSRKTQIPVFDLSDRTRRAVTTAAPYYDKKLTIIEVEVSFREMRSYTGNSREEAVSLRAHLEPGQSASQVIADLQELAGEIVEARHEAYESKMEQERDEAVEMAGVCF